MGNKGNGSGSEIQETLWPSLHSEEAKGLFNLSHAFWRKRKLLSPLLLCDSMKQFSIEA